MKMGRVTRPRSQLASAKRYQATAFPFHVRGVAPAYMSLSAVDIVRLLRCNSSALRQTIEGAPIRQ